LHIKHIAEGPKAVWNTSDVIWRAAGDKSLDMNYYSKRFLLSSVYTMSIKHYISDKQDIDEYIENALNKVVKVAQKLKIPKLEDIPILRMFS
jgi:ubiquinone biosynthesis protein COQ9